MKVLIGDDHAVFRRGLKETLSEAFPKTVFGEARTAQETFELAHVFVTEPRDGQEYGEHQQELGANAERETETLHDLRSRSVPQGMSVDTTEPSGRTAASHSPSAFQR